MNEILSDVRATRTVGAEHVRRLRASLYSDGVVERGELDLFFAIDEAAEARSPEWCELFVEAVVDHIVEQTEPRGYIDEANSDWLLARIAQDGIVKTASELEILIKVLEKATSSPARLSAFALRQVKMAVVDGEGPLARGGELTPGRVGRDEVELIRRILYAFGGEGGIGVTRPEAEVLFDINDATADAQNDPAWSDLFVKAIANCMMVASGYAAPSRQEALRREEWLDEPSGGVGGFLGRVASGGLSGLFNAYRTETSTDSAWGTRNRRHDAASAAAETVDADEAAWLADRISRSGDIHANERALLQFIRDEAPNVHPSLRSLITKAA